MKYKGYVISDIHVGAFDLEALYNEYTELFINRIKKDKDVNFIIVCGDFFDHKFYLNDNSAKMAYRMLKDLITVCKEKNIPLRFVYGTESHECNQYDIMSVMKIYDNVKVITDKDGFALYFSRSVIPYPREEKGVKYFKHIGVYAFRREALLNFAKLPMKPLEIAEKIECLRYLEYGMKIKMIETNFVGVGIDVPEDLEKAREILRNQ